MFFIVGQCGWLCIGGGEIVGKRISSSRYPGVFARDGAKGDRTFYIRFSVDGRRYEEKIGKKSEGYSWALAAEVIRDRVPKVRHRDVTKVQTKVPTWSVMAAAYLEWADANKKSSRVDHIRWRLHLLPRIGAKRADHVDALDFEKLKREMSKNYSPATIRQVLMLASGIWRRSVSWGLVWGESPLASVSSPKVDNSRERFLLPDEVKILLEELRGKSMRDYGLVLMSWSTGARLGELASLRWGDVDLRRQMVTFRETKNGRTRRVPLNDRVVRYFASLKGDNPSQFVWLNSNGEQIKQLQRTSFSRAANALFNQGVEDRRYRVVFHTIRHSFASRLVSEGVPLTVVKTLLGHSSLEMVQRYAHLAPGAERAAVELVG